MPRLLLIDAHGYLHRAYHALPPLCTSKGEPINAILGFARMLLKLLREQKPDFVGVCFDAPGKTFRHEIFTDYKATRKETDLELKSQFPLSRELVDAMGLEKFELPGYEADDLIATAALRAAAQNMEVIIVSGDKDILQLVSPQIKVFNESKKILFDAEEVIRKWGVRPEKIVELFTLIGDSADNVPGVPGIGEKTASKLLQQYGSLDKILTLPDGLSEKIKISIDRNRGQIAQSKDLITLNSAAPIQVDWERCKVALAFPPELEVFCQRLEFYSLLAEVAQPKDIAKSSLGTVALENKAYETILSFADLDRLIQKLRAAGRFAVDVETTGLNIQKSHLVGISFSWAKDNAAYVPLGHRALGALPQLDVDSVIKKIKPILEDFNYAVVGHNLKFDYSILAQAGVRMRNMAFDTLIASYCLDPSKNSHKLKDLAAEILGARMTRFNELFSGKNEHNMEDVEIERAAPYACADADFTLQLADHFGDLLHSREIEKLFTDLEMPLVPILAEMEMAGILVDRPYLNQVNQEFTAQLQSIEKKAHALSGQEFNLNSPKQLAFILFEKLKLPARKKTKTGFSTNEEVLRSLADAHELPRVLISHREISKLKSTYVENLLAVAGEKDARVHTSLNQAVAATGRLSSTDPNLQNIPIRTEQGRMIRKAFVSGPGNVFLSADYSQIDLRALAHLSGDPALSRAFLNGEDIHLSTAAEVNHVTPSLVTQEMRRRAKAVNFGIVYGQQAYGLAQSLGIGMAEAQEMIDTYFLKYSGVRDWMEQTVLDAKKNGYVKTLMGRIRYLPEINAKNNALRSFAERTAINTPVQGTSADIIKAAMINLDQKLKEQRFSGMKMLLQVHDDLLFELPEPELDPAARLVKREMENAVKLTVPILIDLKWGKNWKEMDKLVSFVEA